MPVTKDPEVILPWAPVSERKNMVYAGTLEPGNWVGGSYFNRYEYGNGPDSGSSAGC